MQSPFFTRLQVSDRLFYMRALQTFFSIDGNLTQEETAYLKTVLDKPDQFDMPTVQNALNLIRTFCSLGKIIPQKLINKILSAAFQFPSFVPQLYLFANYINDKSWIFNGILKISSKDSNLIINSIKTKSPIWNFIADEFENDFEENIQIVDKKFDQYHKSLLIESLMYGWEMDKASQISLQEIAREIVRFMLEIKDFDPVDTIISQLYALFPDAIYELILPEVHRLSIPALRMFVQQVKDRELDLNEIGGDFGIISYKLLPYDQELSHYFIEKADPDCATTYNELVEHLFDSDTPRIIPE